MTWESTPIPTGWEYNHDSGARIVLNHRHRNASGHIECVELWAPDQTAPDDEPVAFGRRDLLTVAGQQVFVTEAAAKLKDVPWAEGCSMAFYEVIQADRDGAATVDLATYKPEAMTWVLEPLIEQGGHTRIIAAGESGKSFFAVAMLLSVCTGSNKFLGITPNITGPVLYVDWETDASTTTRRMHALCDAVGEPLPADDMFIYQAQEAPLARVAHQIQRTIKTYKTVAAVIDSTMLARGAAGQRGAEDSALDMFQALRTFGIPVVLIDHKNREDIRKGRTGGYGSVVNQNTVRLEWEMTKFFQVSPHEKKFALSLEKANNIGRLPPIAYRFTVGEGSDGEMNTARFTQIEPSSLPDFDVDDTTERMMVLMQTSNEPMTIDKIRGMLGDEVTAGMVRARLNNDPRFENVAEGKGKTGQWRLTGAPRDDGVQDDFAFRNAPDVENGFENGEVF